MGRRRTTAWISIMMTHHRNRHRASGGQTGMVMCVAGSMHSPRACGAGIRPPSSHVIDVCNEAQRTTKAKARRSNATMRLRAQRPRKTGRLRTRRCICLGCAFFSFSSNMPPMPRRLLLLLALPSCMSQAPVRPRLADGPLVWIPWSNQGAQDVNRRRLIALFPPRTFCEPTSRWSGDPRPAFIRVVPWCLPRWPISAR